MGLKDIKQNYIQRLKDARYFLICYAAQVFVYTQSFWLLLNKALSRKLEGCSLTFLSGISVSWFFRRFCW